MFSNALGSVRTETLVLPLGVEIRLFLLTAARQQNPSERAGGRINSEEL